MSDQVDTTQQGAVIQPVAVSTSSQPAGAIPAGAGPLSPADLRTLEDATRRAKKIRRAATVAVSSGWTMGFFALISVPLAILDLPSLAGIVSLVMGLMLGALTYNELRGAWMLKRYDPWAPRRLGYNQIAFGVLIVAYAAWSVVGTSFGSVLSQTGASGSPEVDQMLGDIDTQYAGMIHMFKYVLYGSVALAGIVGPGLTALYYFSREKLVRSLLAETSPWAIAAMRATAG